MAGKLYIASSPAPTLTLRAVWRIQRGPRTRARVTAGPERLHDEVPGARNSTGFGLTFQYQYTYSLTYWPIHQRASFPRCKMPGRSTSLWLSQRREERRAALRDGVCSSTNLRSVTATWWRDDQRPGFHERFVELRHGFGGLQVYRHVAATRGTSATISAGSATRKHRLRQRRRHDDRSELPGGL